jgi:hypothetical protein
LNHSPTNGNGYTAEVSALDIELDITLGEIRKAQDRHEVTVREAKDMRIAALERQHRGSEGTARRVLRRLAMTAEQVGDVFVVDIPAELIAALLPAACVHCGQRTVPTELGPCHGETGLCACTYNGPTVAEPAKT